MQRATSLWIVVGLALAILVLANLPLSRPGAIASARSEGDAFQGDDPPGPRRPHVRPGPGETLSMSIKRLGNFEYRSPVASIPADVFQLSGTKVRLHGYMIPLDQSEQITRFSLVPDRFNCCFGQPPALQHIVLVECAPGTAVDYAPEEIIVEGKLSVGEVKENGYVLSLFRVACTSVKASGS